MIFLVVTTNTNSIHPIFWYITSTLFNTLITIYTCYSTLSLSCMSIYLITWSVTDRYKQRSKPVTRHVNMGSDAMKAFNLDNSSSHSLVHSNFCFFFKMEKKQTRASKSLVSCWNYLIWNGFFMLIMVWHMYGLVSIPLMVSINPMNLPVCTPKEHLKAFKCMLYLLTDSRMSSRSATWLFPFEVFMIISSI